MTDPMPKDEQVRLIREAVGDCPQILPMPTGCAFIEATCHWLDRDAYILLDRTTGAVLRYRETPKLPLCCPQDARRRPARRRADS